MTTSALKCASAVMMSSTIPSAKYSCSGSELRLVKGRTAIEGLLGRARVSSTGQRCGAAVWDGPDPKWFGDILQGLRTQILKRYIYLATNLPTSVVRDADAARLCDPFEAHCNIDPVTKDIVFFDNNITDVNADAEFDLLVLRHVDILFGHAALNFVGTSDGVDNAGELGNSAVPGILDNTSVMLSDFGI